MGIVTVSEPDNVPAFAKRAFSPVDQYSSSSIRGSCGVGISFFFSVYFIGLTAVSETGARTNSKSVMSLTSRYIPRDVQSGNAGDRRARKLLRKHVLS